METFTACSVEAELTRQAKQTGDVENGGVCLNEPVSTEQRAAARAEAKRNNSTQNLSKMLELHFQNIDKSVNVG